METKDKIFFDIEVKEYWLNLEIHIKEILLEKLEINDNSSNNIYNSSNNIYYSSNNIYNSSNNKLIIKENNNQNENQNDNEKR